MIVPSRNPAAAPDPRLERALRHAVCAGVVLTVLLPWRSEWLGFTPLWLLGMPLSAWWALHRFRLPARKRAGAVRRRGVQARRWSEAGPKRLIGQGFRRAA